jgi:hypothetical protein
MYINSNYDPGKADTTSCTSVDKKTYEPYVDCSSSTVPSGSDGAVMRLLIQHVEPLLYKYKVDIGFYGHNHVVQRHSAIFNNTGKFPLIYICNLHVLSNLLLIYICKLNWNFNTIFNDTVIQRATEMVDEDGRTYYLHDDPGATVHMVIGKLLRIYICNFHILSHLLLIYIRKLHWNLNTIFVCQVNYFGFTYVISIS